MKHARKHALEIFRAALVAADPDQAVMRTVKFDGRYLTAGRRYDLTRFDRIQVIGAGKAGRAMAQALERLLGRRIHGGWVNVPDGAAPLKRLTLHACSHPVPDERGEEGARRILQIAETAGPRDLLLCVISGGASALLPLPSPPLALAEKQEITRRLLASGATIHEMNTVRKHLSGIKGGQLAKAAWPATLISLILSDVPGDDLATIGSGPTVPDPSTVEDALRILNHYGIPGPSTALRETPKPGDPALARARSIIIGSNRLALDAAARKARDLGYRPLLLSSFIEGETREVAKVHAAIAKEVLASARPVRRPACILSGGETTVTVRGHGKGGRNQEFVLAAALALEDYGPAVIFSAGTDGIDGPTDAAGAYVDSSTLPRARALHLDPRQYLDNNDSYHFFEQVQALIKTGPTGTNVMDVRMILLPRAS